MKSDKTVLDILEDFLDEHAGESAWEDAEKALNAHYLTVAERLIGEDETSEDLVENDLFYATRNGMRAELRTAFRKEYGESDE